jgi:site-specific DNA-methyltransferase (adenine-specific)
VNLTMPTAENPVTVICGDCLGVMKDMADCSVDAVVTDPPYNVGLAYDGYDDDRPDDEYEAWCRLWFAECCRVAKRVILFPGHGNLGMWLNIERPRGIGCWYKPGNPAGGGVFQFCEWEPWLLYGSGIRIGLSNTIRATVSNQQDTGDHPCPKPLLLMREVLKRIKKATLVLDPFAGSGSTLVAAVAEGRRAIGIELNPDYAAIARKRVQEALGLGRGSLLTSLPAASLFEA